MRKRLRRPSPAMAVAMAALFVALSGAAYAANVAKNSVGAKQIKTNAVRAAEIQDGAVGANEIPDGSLTEADVQNESLKSADVDGLASGDITDESLNGGDVEDGTLGSGEVADESLSGGDLQDGSVGSGDVQGLTSGDFADGQLPGVVTVQRTDYTVATGSSDGADVTCPADQTAIAGGASTDSTASTVQLLVNRPGVAGDNPTDGESFTSWRSIYRNDSGQSIAGRVYVICVDEVGEGRP